MPSIDALYSLEGKVAVVTGAGSGIGYAAALRLAEVGASVVAVDRNEAALDELAIAGRSVGSIACVLRDVSRPEAIDDIFLIACDRVGRPDIWVNCAGLMSPTGNLAHASDEALAALFEVNVWPAFRVARLVERHLLGGSVIINLASINGLRGAEGVAGYVMTKHALVGLTRALARDLGARGVRCVAIAPGFVATESARATIAELQRAGKRPSTQPATPLSRAITPDDVARAIVFAASDMAAMITGQVLVVDGGTTA